MTEPQMNVPGSMPNEPGAPKPETAAEELRKHPLYRTGIAQIRQDVLTGKKSASDVAAELLDSAGSDEQAGLAAIQFGEDAAQIDAANPKKIFDGRRKSRETKHYAGLGEEELETAANKLKSNAQVDEILARCMSGQEKLNTAVNELADREALSMRLSKVQDPIVENTVRDILADLERNDQSEVEPTTVVAAAPVRLGDVLNISKKVIDKAQPALPAAEPYVARDAGKPPEPAPIENPLAMINQQLRVEEEALRAKEEYKAALKEVVRRVLYFDEDPEKVMDRLEQNGDKNKVGVLNLVDKDLRRIKFFDILEGARAHGGKKAEDWLRASDPVLKSTFASEVSNADGPKIVLDALIGKKKAPSDKQLTNFLGLGIAMRRVIKHVKRNNAELAESLETTLGRSVNSDEVYVEAPAMARASAPTARTRSAATVPAAAALADQLAKEPFEKPKTIAPELIKGSPEYRAAMIDACEKLLLGEEAPTIDECAAFGQELRSRGNRVLEAAKEVRRHEFKAAADDVADQLTGDDAGFEAFVKEATEITAQRNATQIFAATNNLDLFKRDVAGLVKKRDAGGEEAQKNPTIADLAGCTIDALYKKFEQDSGSNKKTRALNALRELAPQKTEKATTSEIVSPAIEQPPAAAAHPVPVTKDVLAQLSEKLGQGGLKPAAETDEDLFRRAAARLEDEEEAKRKKQERLARKAAGAEQAAAQRAADQQERDALRELFKSARPITGKDIARTGSVMTVPIFFDRNGGAHTAPRALYKYNAEPHKTKWDKEGKDPVAERFTFADTGKRVAFAFEDSEFALRPNIESGEPYQLMVRVTARETDPSDPNTEIVTVKFPEVEQFTAGETVMPVALYKATDKDLVFMLPDGGRVRLWEAGVRDIVDPDTGYLKNSTPPRFPYLRITGLDKEKDKPRGQVREFDYYASVVTPDQLGFENKLTKILQKYHEQSVFPTWQPPKDSRGDFEPPQPVIPPHRLTYPPQMREKLMKEIREGSRTNPLEIVLSGKEGVLRESLLFLDKDGADRLDTELDRIAWRAREDDVALQLIAQLRTLKKPAAETLHVFRNQKNTSEFADRVRKADFWEPYEKFFEYLQKPEVTELFGYDARARFFPSDFDGETACKMFELAGIRTRVFVYPPAGKRAGGRGYAVYRPDAVHLDISHGSSDVMQENELPKNPLPEWRAFNLFLDEDDVRTFSAAGATERHLRELGFVPSAKEGPLQARLLTTLANLTDDIDSFRGVYADKRALEALYTNLRRNVFGLLSPVIEGGHYDIAYKALRLTMNDIFRGLVTQHQRLNRLDDVTTAEVNRRIVERMTTYDFGRRLCEAASGDRLTDIEAIIAKQEQTLGTVEQRVRELEQKGFVCVTRFGKTLLDPGSALRPINGLAAFVRGYDCYVGYNAGAHTGRINLAPQSAQRIPQDLVRAADGGVAGSVVKGGHLLVMNAATKKISGFGELVRAVFSDGEKAYDVPDMVQAYTAAERAGGNKLKDFISDVHPGILKDKFGPRQPKKDAEQPRQEGPVVIMPPQPSEKPPEKPAPAPAAALELPATTPPPPDKSRLIETSPQLDLEQLFAQALTGLRPENMKQGMAHAVLDLARARTDIRCPRAGLSGTEIAHIWQPTAERWWKSLTDAEHGALIAAAKKFETDTDKEAVLRATRFSGYQRLLQNIFIREPEREYEIYAAVKEGREAVCPEGFGPHACAEWKIFVSRNWYGAMSAAERARLDDGVRLRADIPAAQSRLEAQHAQKTKELEKYSGAKGRLLRMFATPERSSRAGTEYPQDRLAREIREIDEELQRIAALKATLRELALYDARLHSAGERSGIGSSALTIAEKIEVPAEKGGASAANLDGAILLQLSGQSHAVPSAVSPWILEAAGARAASDVRADAATERTRYEPSAYARDDEAHLFALQTQITEGLADAVARGVSLQTATEKEPLKSLIKAMRDVGRRLTPEIQKHHTQFGAYLDQMVAATDTALRQRRVEPADARKLIPARDQSWIAALLDEMRKPESGEPPSLPTMSPEKREQLADVRLRTSTLARADFNLSRTLHDFIKTFAPEKEARAIAHDARQFLRDGWVYERGSTERKGFFKGGEEWVTVQVGDRVTAVQDDSAPHSMHIEIERAPLNDRVGYSEISPTGSLLYYDKSPDGTVHVWESDDKTRGAQRYRGYFDGTRFVERTESLMRYTTADGKIRVLGEFDDTAVYDFQGRVFAKRSARGAERLTQLGTRTDRPLKSPKVDVRQSGGTIVEIDLNDPNVPRYITPRGHVVEYHRSLGQMRDLGVIQRES